MSFPIGRTVKEVRWMTEEEWKAEGWDDFGDSHHRCAVIVLDDGSKIYASADGEGNGPGCMFGKDENGEGFYIDPSS